MSQQRKADESPTAPPVDETVPEARGTVEDSTLGGYLRVHDRPPAFQGPDGHPYTVSIEVEKVADLRQPFEGFLVFPRWAQSGLGIIGHVETPTLWRGRSSDDIRRAAGALALREVQELLAAALRKAELIDA